VNVETPIKSSSLIESRTRQIGHDLFHRAKTAARHTPSIAAWFDRTMMRLSMHDPAVRAQLFRLVDVLPVLRSPAQINDHLREYLGQVRDRLPTPLQTVLDHLPHDGWAGTRLANTAEWVARHMANRFIAAATIDDAAERVLELRRQNLTFTIDLLGEAVVSEAEAAAYAAQYLELIEKISDRLADATAVPLLDVDHMGRPIPRVNVSVKLSSLYSQFDPVDPAGTTDAVLRRLRPILRLAKSRGAFVNLDMEQSAYKDLTLSMFKTVLDEEEFRRWPDVGIAIQAYLRSTAIDLAELAQWAKRRGTPIWIRLVKGAYWDYEVVIAAQNDWPVTVFTDKAATDANFEQCTQLLIQSSNWLRPAIASHNVRSIAAALAVAESARLQRGAMEFQLLHGMAEPIRSALLGRGERVRLYLPVGQLLPGMAYLVRRLLENTSNDSFLRAGFLEHAPMEKLLMNPTDLVRERSGGAKTSVAVRHENASAFPPFRNEPVSDFSRADAREAMMASLRDVAAKQLGRTWPLVIGGNRIDTPRAIESINSSLAKRADHPQRLVGRSACATVEHAHEAIAVAKAAQSWRDVPAQDRAELLRRVAAVLRRRRFELAAVEVYESGKPWREADADVAEAIDFCEYYARQMVAIAHADEVDVPGEMNATVHDAAGVAVIIAPWNFPLAILCGMTAAAIVTGNPAIMKPAEQSPVIAAMLMEAFEEAGAPAGVVNYLPGIGEEIGPLLVSHPDVAVVAFTGSRAVGLSINRHATEPAAMQRQVKHVITEMGGKNAIIVDDDADLDEAVTGVVASAFGYSGQKCSACSRVIVLSSIYDTFVSRLIEATRSLTIAPAEDPACRVGPVIDAEAERRILAAIERGKREAKLAFAGDTGTLASEGYFIAPHVFVDVRPESFLAQEEIFGPVLAVIRAGDLIEALAIANGTAYALTGGVYSRSPEHLQRCRREFRVGNLYLNRKITGALVGRQPFGGFKMSGGGTKAGGAEYLLHFLVPRTVTENTLRRGFAAEVEN
jgi:RHH-type proline utilization regulon transcriptional repressor/proline dehydrogenase/delta 1-pyrroline-5-carboxylate dehydrogenase